MEQGGTILDVVSRLELVEKRLCRLESSWRANGPGKPPGQDVASPKSLAFKSIKLDRDNVSVYSHATTGMSMPALFVENITGATKKGATGRCTTDCNAKCPDQDWAGGDTYIEAGAVGHLSFSQAMASVHGNLGTDPEPWISLLTGVTPYGSSETSQASSLSGKPQGSVQASSDILQHPQARDQLAYVMVSEHHAGDPAPALPLTTSIGPAIHEAAGFSEDASRQAAMAANSHEPVNAAQAVADGASVGVSIAMNPGGQHGAALIDDKTRACMALVGLCNKDEAARLQVCRTGCLPHIIQLLESTSAVSRKAAASLLWYLSRSEAAQQAIGQHPHCIACLVQATAASDVFTAKAAALVLNNVSMQAELRRAVLCAGGVAALVDMLRSSDGVGQEAAAAALMNLTEDDAEARHQLVEAGGVQALVTVLKYGEPQVQDSAAGALQNLSMEAGSEAVLAAAGAIPVLLEVLRAGSLDAQDSALKALGNLAVSDSCHHEIIDVGGAARMAQLSASDEEEVRADAVQALLNLCAGSPETKHAVHGQGGTRALLHVARDASGPLQAAALLGLLSLSTKLPVCTDLFKAGAGPVLLQLLLGGSPRAKELSAKVLTNLSTLEGAAKGVLVQQGAAVVLVELLRTGTPGAQQAACRALQNLSRLPSNRTAILGSGAIPTLVRAASGTVPMVSEAAAGALYNLCTSSGAVQEVVQQGGVASLVMAARTVHPVGSKGCRLLVKVLQRLAQHGSEACKEVAAKMSELGLLS